MIKKILKKITPHFLLGFYHYLWAFFGALIFGFPSRKLTIIGVTGTSGKSTTVNFITKILEEAGNKVVSNSSIRFKVGDKERENDKKMGMPGRFFMQKLLWQGVKAGCNYAVLEVTSEGIKQFRHKFINFDTAVFTNLSPEHIESHGGFENYRNEKLKLFKATKNIHVINTDDENAQYFLDVPAEKVIIFGIKGGQKHTNILKYVGIFAEQVSGTNFSVNNVPFSVKVLGNFNVYNALAAIAAVSAYGIPLATCQKVLEKVQGIPGRMEIVNKEPLVVVDYAHTPVQLEEAYKSLAGKNLVCVLGSCGGGRDKWKRPVLGEIAAKYCKEIIITDEDPYDEDPLEIMEKIAEGVGEKPHSIVLDRKEAIKKAILLAKPEDAVIITGKGSENVMCVKNGKKIPFDDRQVVREVLKR